MKDLTTDLETAAPPMRVVDWHVVEGDTAPQLKIQVLDAPGQGGACHQYLVSGLPQGSVAIDFQNGPIREVGVNGITEAALVAIVIDRLQHFQAGPFACPENELASANAWQLLGALQSRTRARIARGVEGINQK